MIAFRLYKKKKFPADECIQVLKDIQFTSDKVAQIIKEPKLILGNPDAWVLK